MSASCASWVGCSLFGSIVSALVVSCGAFFPSSATLNERKKLVCCSLSERVIDTHTHTTRATFRCYQTQKAAPTADQSQCKWGRRTHTKRTQRVTKQRKFATKTLLSLFFRSHSSSFHGFTTTRAPNWSLFFCNFYCRPARTQWTHLMLNLVQRFNVEITRAHNFISRLLDKVVVRSQSAFFLPREEKNAQSRVWELKKNEKKTLSLCEKCARWKWASDSVGIRARYRHTHISLHTLKQTPLLLLPLVLRLQVREAKRMRCTHIERRLACTFTLCVLLTDFLCLRAIIDTNWN